MRLFGGKRDRRNRLPDLNGVRSPTIDIQDDIGPDVSITVDREHARIDISPITASSRLISMRSRDLRGWMQRIVMSNKYDYMVTSVVVANAITIGVEQKFRLEQNDQELFHHLEALFLTFYISELLLNWITRGWQCFHNNWVRFDTLLVFIGLASQILDSYVRPGQSTLLSSVFLLRIARLLRLARLLRTMRLVNKFRELWMLARGLLDSMSTTFYTMIFGLLILYVVACMTVELVPLAMQDRGDSIEPEVANIVRDNFSTMPLTLLTLVQFITFDNVVYIYKPLIEADGTLALFFIPVLFLVGIVYMNLVTAIIVNSGFEQAVADRDMKKKVMKAKSKRLIRELEEAFLRADANESGTICREELASIDLDGREFLQGILGVDDLAELFDTLDVDNIGEVGISDFCTGVNDIVIQETPLVTKRNQRMIELLRIELKETREMQDNLAKVVERLFSTGGGPTDATSSEAPSNGKAVADEPKMKEEPAAEVLRDAHPAGRRLRSKESMLEPKISQADEREMPAWADKLMADLKQDVRLAMDEACTSFMAQVTDGAMSLPSTPRENSSLCPSEGGTAAAAAAAAAAAGAQRQPVREMPSAGWEVLPPEEPRRLTGLTRPEAPARRSPEPPAAGHKRDDQEQRAQPASADAAASPNGAKVPDSRRPQLLLHPGTGAAGSSTSAWSGRRQA